MLRNADGGGSNFPRKKRYEGVTFNVISVTSGWVGFQFPEKKHYVTLEWPPINEILILVPERDSEDVFPEEARHGADDLMTVTVES